MKFADKLFLLTTVVLTLFFTVFGIWMLHSNFSRLLNREIEQGNLESRMFRYLFEMGYQSMEEYGEEYAVNKTLDSIKDSVEINGNHIFVIQGMETGAPSYVYGGSYIADTGTEEEITALVNSLTGNNN